MPDAPVPNTPSAEAKHNPWNYPLWIAGAVVVGVLFVGAFSHNPAKTIASAVTFGVVGAVGAAVNRPSKKNENPPPRAGNREGRPAEPPTQASDVAAGLPPVVPALAAAPGSIDSTAP